MTEAERKLLVEELIAHSEFKAAGAIENDGRRISVLLETIETQAREIERLREALEHITDIEPDADNMGRFHDIARAALAGDSHE